MMIKSILILTFTLALIGCAPPAKPTKAKISIGAAAADFPGGVMIYAKSGDRRFSAKIINETFIEHEFENGAWDFYAVGYSGANFFQGENACEFLPVNFDGGDVNLNLMLDKNKCQQESFGNTLTKDTNFQFLPLRIHTCAEIQDDFAKARLSGGQLPAMEDFCEFETGKERSFKVKFISTHNGIIESGCIASGGSSFANSTLKIPMTKSVELHFEIEGYMGTTCAGNPVQKADFKNGLLNFADQNQGLGREFDLTGTYNHVYLNSKMCDAAGIANSPFANGNPANGWVYACTVEHLAELTNHDSKQLMLAQDITNPSGTATGPIVNGSFFGEVDGDGHSIKNLTISGGAIFDDINGAKVHNLILENITINGVGATTGILANVLTRGATKTEIKNIEIKGGSVITNNGYVGSIAGDANFEAAGSVDEVLTIENVISNADVTNTVTTQGAGGLLGRFIGPSGTGLQSEIIDSRYYGTVHGKHKVGGLVGHMLRGKIALSQVARPNSNIKVQIKGEQMVGGLVGFIEDIPAGVAEISGTYTNVQLITSSGTSFIDFGGMIGHAQAVRLISNYSDMKIISPNIVTGAGGLIGAVDANSSSQSDIYNNGVLANLVVDGTRTGGLIGVVKGTQAVGVAYNLVQGSVANSDPTNTANSKMGGLIGFNQDNPALGMTLNVVNNMTVEGHKEIGGLIGNVQGGVIKENYFNGDVIAHAPVNGLSIGCQIGRLNANTVAEYSNNMSNGKVMIAATGAPSAVTDSYSTMGSAIGVFDIIGGNVVTMGHIASNCAGFYDVTNTNTAVNIPMVVQFAVVASNPYDGTLGTLLDPIDGAPCEACAAPQFTDAGGGNPELLFVKAWKKFGEDQNGNISTAGNLIDPFQISTAADWNKIGDDLLLMSKSFMIMNDIDFGWNSVTPIGSNMNPFIGQMLNNYDANVPPVLKRIKIDDNDGTHDFKGLFRVVGDNTNNSRGSIGITNHPLQIDGIKIGFPEPATPENAVMVGVIGNARDANVFMNVKNALIEGYTCNGANCYGGGLIGDAQNVSVLQSSFEGKVNLPSFDYVGGVIGNIGAQTSDVTLAYSKAQGQFTGLSAGGLIGQYFANGNIEIKDNYVDLNNGGYVKAVGIAGDATAGLLSNALIMSGVVEVERNYVNLLGADAAGALQLMNAADTSIASIRGTNATDGTFIDNHYVNSGNLSDANAIYHDSANGIKLVIEASFPDYIWVFPINDYPRLRWERCGFDDQYQTNLPPECNQ
jgi:hypothetical protein